MVAASALDPAPAVVTVILTRYTPLPTDRATVAEHRRAPAPFLSDDDSRRAQSAAPPA
ncbi:hypothetical protein [Streptomyces wedmorensis]|uniref:hypothetical protein n=1 Tax=Streptomyces wedmorensis TaxID=43759 RepID=UPI0037BC01ED